MRIPKFYPGQTVYYLYENKVCNGIVLAVKAIINHPNPPAYTKVNAKPWGYDEIIYQTENGQIPEERMAATKKDLAIALGLL